MPRISLLQRLAPRASSAVVAERLAKARLAVADAEAQYRSAVLETLAAGQDSSPAEYSADQALTKAKADVVRLEAALVEAQSREGASAKADLEVQQAEQDAKVQAAYDDWAATTKPLAAALEAYASAFDAFAEAGRKAAGLAIGNPRARQDIVAQNVEALVSLELTRLAKAHMPPGPNKLAATIGDRHSLRTLADTVEDLASAIIPRRGQ